MTCPICAKNYIAIEKSFSVCKEHERWFVTRCVNCQRIKFSTSVGMCEDCFPVSKYNLTTISDTLTAKTRRRRLPKSKDDENEK